MDHRPSAIGCLSLTLTVADAPKLQITLTSTVAPDAWLQRKPKLQHKPNLGLSLSTERGGDQGLGVFQTKPKAGVGLGIRIALAPKLEPRLKLQSSAQAFARTQACVQVHIRLQPPTQTA